MIGGLRVVVPEHELTICGGDPGKIGSCRCGGWFVSRQATSDDVTSAYLGHLAAAGAVHSSACDRCQRDLATVRSGGVELCSECAFVEVRSRAVADLVASA